MLAESSQPAKAASPGPTAATEQAASARARTVLVVVPAHNRREMTLQAVRSVLAQRVGGLRCLVVDDASSDGTAEALRALQDERVEVLVNAVAAGGAAARNQGLSYGGDERWVAFLDCDDLWAPSKLGRQLAALDAFTGSGWSATACVDVGGDLSVLHALRMAVPGAPGADHLLGVEQMRDMFFADNAVPAGNSTVVASRELLTEVGGYDTGLATCEDWDLWLKLSRLAPLAYVDAPLVAYRIWDGQMSMDQESFVRDAATVRSRHYPGREPPSVAYAARWQREAAWRNIRAGNPRSAAANYVRAALLGRQPGQLAYAAASLAAPGLVRRRLAGHQRREGLPEGWDGEAATWLAPYAGGAEPAS